MATIVREWEEFAGGPEERVPSRMHVTVNARGLILINRRVHERLGACDKVMLLYDRRTQAIGIRAAGPGDAKPFSFKTYRGHSHREINAGPFCRHYGIRPTETIRFTHPEIDHNGILILDLQKAEPLVGSKRKQGTVNSEQ